MKRNLAINMQIFAVFEVFGGPYCNRNVSNSTETYAANLKFCMVTCDKLKQSTIQYLFYFAVHDKKLWITYRTMVTNAN